VQPVGCVFSCIDTAQPAVKVDGRHGSDADQVAQQALNFCDLFVHGGESAWIFGQSQRGDVL